MNKYVDIPDGKYFAVIMGNEIDILVSENSYYYFELEEDTGFKWYTQTEVEVKNKRLIIL